MRLAIRAAGLAVRAQADGVRPAAVGAGAGLAAASTVSWAAWCAGAVVVATRTRWRHLSWFYPSATTLVVLASANHFLLDATGGLLVAGCVSSSPWAKPPASATANGPHRVHGRA